METHHLLMEDRRPSNDRESRLIKHRRGLGQGAPPSPTKLAVPVPTRTLSSDTRTPSLPECFKLSSLDSQKKSGDKDEDRRTGNVRADETTGSTDLSTSLPLDICASTALADPHRETARRQGGFSLTEYTVRQNSLMEEIKNLKHIITASQDEKSQEIHRLREELRKMKNCCLNCEQENVSLSTETETLKGQLQVTAAQCQELVKQLERREASKSSKNQRENVNYEREIEKLRNQLHEVIEANMKWQLYNNQRDTYVNSLLKQLADFKNKVEHSKRSPLGEISEDAQKEIDRILISAKEKVNAMQEEKEALEDELRRFKLLCDQKEHRIVELEEQIRHLSSKPSATRDDDIEMLKHQVRLCTEDFEAERRDREMAQSKMSDLETQLELLKRQLDMYENSAATAMANQRENALQNYKMNFTTQTPFGLRSRGPVQYGEVCSGRTVPDFMSNDLEEDCDFIDDHSPPVALDGPPQIQNSIKNHTHYNGQTFDQTREQTLKPNNDAGYDVDSLHKLGDVSVTADDRLDSDAELNLIIERSKQDVGGPYAGVFEEVKEGLRCPRCDMHFDTSKHLELLEHMDECTS